jgi:hypothetical protein
MWTNENRARYNRAGLRYPSDLTDAAGPQPGHHPRVHDAHAGEQGPHGLCEDDDEAAMVGR